ncbi:FAD-binding oxidoreductase [Mesobacillus sp. AQ2]|jgi:glycolate oxidase FAD binding subunit|uniref:FAD-binding oxidoreductase n=1 Tax=Bacillaceae TaxID=186817 RepID=UPI0011A8D7EF|nr:MULTISPECIES: FAD-binding oxidoreductase [Bacillaceae]WHX38696.1 FAD-binding oxidoreductase [Mesobacillus sp. AQ2]
MITAELLTEIKAVFPETQISEGGDGKQPFGNGGVLTVFPNTEKEIASLLKYANETNKTVNVIGGGTKKGYGGTTESADILLSLSNCKGIVEHVPGDMTLTVKPGTTFKEIQDYLLDFNQKIALDPFLPAYATIGGIISANDSGPKRLGYGSARDAVIGLRIVYPDGTVIRSGGKVVKNVAGYDMNKLFIGAMGTLGVISEITLKLRPVAKYESLVLLKFRQESLEDARTFAVKLLDTVIEPVALELINPSLSAKLLNEKVYTMAVSLEDVESSVMYQEDFIQKHKPSESSLDILRNEEARSFWNEFYGFVPNAAVSNTEKQTEAILKIGTVNMNVIKILQECQVVQDSHNLLIEAHGGLGHGISQLVLKGAEADINSAIHPLRSKAEELSGYAVVRHLPLEQRKMVNVWGEKQAHQFILDGIKTKIDPNRVLNPGRFVGGI